MLRISEASDSPPSTLGRSRLTRILTHYPGLIVGGFLFGLLVFAAIFAPWLGTVDPAALAPSLRLAPPSDTAWLGTDMLGRDVYSRAIYGARISLSVGVSVALLTAIFGTAIGILSGYVRWLDPIIMRITDGLMAIPAILLAIALMSVTRGSIVAVVVAISLSQLPQVIRLIRGVVLTIRELPFFEAAIAAGSSPLRIVYNHVLPNVLIPLSVQATYICAAAIMTEAALSFIGAGTPPMIPSWGNMIADARTLWQIKPHLIAVPAIFLTVTVLAINLVGDSVRDLLDPRFSKGRK